MKHVVMFSGGVGSWATAKRAAVKHGTKNMLLLCANVHQEDEDWHRFILEAATDVGAPLVMVQDGRTPWQVFHDVRFMGNARVAKCSLLLKVVPCSKWLEANLRSEDTRIYVGIDWSEAHRIKSIVTNWKPWCVRAPLCQPPYSDKAQMLAELQASGIRLPRLYELGFPHNNCGGGCVKGGISHWLHLLKTMPERYRYHEEQEESLRRYLGKGVSILRDRTGGHVRPLTLKELRENTPVQLDLFDWGGCGCFVDAEDDGPEAAD